MRVRVTAVAAVVVAVVLALGGIALGGFLYRGLVRSASGSALQRTAEVTALAARQPLPSVLPPVDAPRRTLIQVADDNGNVVSATAPLIGTPLLVRAAAGGDVIGLQPALGPGRWLAQPTPATLNGRPAVVVVYTSLADVDRAMHVFVGLMVVALPVAAGFVALVVWAVTGRALAPVEAMRREAAAITSASLDRRVPEPPTHDEIARLAATLNDMLTRLDATNERQRQFMADASHELRTPLANLRTAVEVSLAHPELADWTAVSDDVLRQAARIERLTDDLLVLTTGDANRSTAGGEVFDLAALADRELGRPTPGVRVVQQGQPGQVPVAGDRHEIGRVLTNLLDNAFRYARSEVVVGVRAGTRWAEVWVADDGPGVPPAYRDRVFDRFFRLDEHRDRSVGGVGLGLAIARDLAERNGGTLTLDRHGEGATFRLRLPLAAPPASSRTAVSVVS